MIIKTYDDNLSKKQIDNIVSVLENEGIVIIPTDTLYAFVCDILSKKAAKNLAELKGKVLEKSNFSLLCENLSASTPYTKPLGNKQFSFIRNLQTGGFTFVLSASNLTPKIFQSKKKTIGIRLPENKICLDILQRLGRPLLVSSVPHSEDMQQEDFTCAELLEEKFGNRVAMVIESDSCKNIPSTVVNLVDDEFVIEREGLGIVE